MKYSEKPAGKTLAESLGIVVDPKAPGGQKLGVLAQEGDQRSSRGHGVTSDQDYDGFFDLDAYGRSS